MDIKFIFGNWPVYGGTVVNASCVHNGISYQLATRINWEENGSIDEAEEKLKNRIIVDIKNEK